MRVNPLKSNISLMCVVAQSVRFLGRKIAGRARPRKHVPEQRPGDNRVANTNYSQNGQASFPAAAAWEKLRLDHWVVATAVTLAVLVAAFVAYGIWRGYGHAVRDGETGTRNLAKVVAAHAEQGIKAIDRNLATTEEVLLHWPSGGSPTPAQVNWLLGGRLRLNPNVLRLQILDSQDRITHEAAALPRQVEATVPSHAYFEWHRAHPPGLSHVSAPVKSRALGTTYIPVSRRLTTADGQFGGVIVAALDPRLLEEFYSSVETGPNGSIAILLRDGTLLARGPRMESRVGASLARTRLFRELLDQSPRGNFRQISLSDGVPRVFGYAAVTGTDLVVVAGFGQDDVLAGWRAQSLVDLAATAIFIAALCLLTCLLMRQLRRQQALTRGLALGEARYRRLLDTANEGIFKVDAQRRIVLVNAEVRAMLGYSEAEMLGADPVDFVFEEDRPRAQEMSAFRREKDAARYDMRLRRRDGAVIWTIISVRSIFDDSGQYTGALAMLTDITQRAHAEQALQKNHQRLVTLHALDRAILEAQSREAIAAIGLTGLREQVPYWGATVMAFDFTANRAVVLDIRRPADSAYDPGALPSLDDYGRADIATLRSGAECVIEDMEAMPARPAVLQRLYDKGMRSYVRIPMLAEGELVGAMNLGSNTPGAYTPEQVAIARSFADQLAIALRQAELRGRLARQAAELEQRVAERTADLENVNRELEAFSYSVSHDLRAPARHVAGFAAMLMEDGARLDEESQALVRRIAKAAARMSALIDDLLSLARTGTMPLRRIACGLGQTVAEIVEELMPQAGGRRIEWKIHDLGPAECDPALLRVVLQNLIGNAFKYSSRCERAVIEIGRQDGAGSPPAFFVRDNGAGFDMKYVDRLFGAFSRLHSSSEFEGSGIGLATARRIIDRHGGRIWAEAQPGLGATFYFTLAAP
ncbi:MAG: domain S-box [Betaproteobacteria bacterium]|nr:domain S-box [Betaproteobacteria bacterium]